MFFWLLNLLVLCGTVYFICCHAWALHILLPVHRCLGMFWRLAVSKAAFGRWCSRVAKLLKRFERFLDWQVDWLPFRWLSKVGNVTVSVGRRANWVNLIFWLYLLYLIFLLVLERTNQVYALLNRSYRSDLVVDFHRLMRASLICILTCLVGNGSIEELAFRLVNLLIRTAM